MSEVNIAEEAATSALLRFMGYDDPEEADQAEARSVVVAVLDAAAPLIRAAAYEELAETYRQVFPHLREPGSDSLGRNIMAELDLRATELRERASEAVGGEQRG